MGTAVLSFLARGLTLAKRLGQRWYYYAYVARHVEHLHGPKRLERSTDSAVVLTVVKDGEAYIEAFIEHHLRLGFDHMVLMDNGSCDRTLAIAASYEQVTVLRCLLPFGQYKQHMCAYMARRFSAHRWCLLADCDEFFDYPLSGQLSLTQLVRYLNQQQATAVLVQMLDLYPQGILDAQWGSVDFRQHHGWFELDSIAKKPVPAGLDNQLPETLDLQLHYGGVRKRVFGAEPLLSKFSLIKPNGLLQLVGLHLVSWARVADLSCLVYHYKFLAGFTQRVTAAVGQGQYYRGALEYRQYQAKLQASPPLELWCSQSLELGSAEQLLELEFIKASATYRQLGDGKAALDLEGG